MRRSRFIAVSRGRALSAGAADPIGDALRADVVAYYKLGDVNDSGPNGYNLTNNNSVTFSSGKVGNAADFVAASNQSLSRTGSDLNGGAGDFSFSMWVKYSPQVDKAVFSKISTLFSSGYSLLTKASGELSFIFSDAFNNVTCQTSGLSIDDNAWHHIAINADRDGNVSIYADGTLNVSEDMSAATGGLANHTDPFYIGDHPTGGLEYTGAVDEFGLWRRLLTVDEIAHLYNSGDGRSLY